MPRINLLPWREGERKERKLAFLVALGVAALAAGVTAFAAYLLYGSMNESQEHRNAQLRTEIKTLDKQSDEINTLELAKQKFIVGTESIENLQLSRTDSGPVLDETFQTPVAGLCLTSRKKTR